jgi:hypothetical protein
MATYVPRPWCHPNWFVNCKYSAAQSAALRSVAHGTACVARVTALPGAGALSAHEAAAQEGMLEKLKANITKETIMY